MGMMKFRTRWWAKVLVSTLALMVATACNPEGNARPPLEVKKISSSRFQAIGDGGADEALAAECAKWQLTKEQVQRFFQISTVYKESPYSEFYQLPCSIGGVIEAEGKTWEFTINAGATAVWRSDGEVRYFGCSAAACESLVLMMPDGMSP